MLVFVYIHWQIDISCDTFINVSVTVRLWRPSRIWIVGRVRRQGGFDLRWQNWALSSLVCHRRWNQFAFLYSKRVFQWCHRSWLFGFAEVLNTFTQSGEGLITDARGGTVDISAYRYALNSLLWSSFLPSGFRMESRHSSTMVISTAISPELERWG